MNVYVKTRQKQANVWMSCDFLFQCVADCVLYYYLTKKNHNYKTLVRRNYGRRRGRNQVNVRLHVISLSLSRSLLSYSLIHNLSSESAGLSFMELSSAAVYCRAIAQLIKHLWTISACILLRDKRLGRGKGDILGTRSYSEKSVCVWDKRKHYLNVLFYWCYATTHIKAKGA